MSSELTQRIGIDSALQQDHPRTQKAVIDVLPRLKPRDSTPPTTTYAAGERSWGSRFVDRLMPRSPRAVTARPAAILRAAFTSALHGPALQDSHSKTAWLLRFPGATCPH